MVARVSILMPVYNAALTLEAAVQSLLRQSMPEFELVIVNDGSTDETPNLLRQFAQRDPRVIVLETPHRGIVAALNEGLQVCRCELIARMDADDICHRDRLAQQVRFMESHPEISVCGSLVKMFPKKNLLGGMLRYEQWLNSLVSPEEIARDIFVESPLAHPSVMLRRNELLDLGGYHESSWVEDYDLWLRYHLHGKRLAKVPKVLLFWRHMPGRVTVTDPRCSLEAFLRAKAHYISVLLARVGRPVVLWGAGQTGRRLLKHLMREGVVPMAIVDVDAKKIGHKLRGVQIVSPEWLAMRDVFVVTAVSSLGARDLIRKNLARLGFQETRDFICAA